MSALSMSSVPLPWAYPRGGRVRCYSADREAGTPLVSLGSCAPGPQERSFSYNTHLRPPPPQHRDNKTGNGKARGAKGDRNMQRGRSVYWVLYVYTEPCANAGGEVRGDLEDGAFVA
jgi:hypothetical protein